MRNKVSIYIFFIFLQSIGNAAEGSLDTSFDTDGIVTTTINSGGDYAYDVAVQPDGKIVVVGYTNSGSEYDLAIVRYNEDGSLDASFDNDGIKVIDIGQEDFGQSVVLQSDGKILIGGTTRIGSNDFLLVRLNSDGSLDTSFDSDGIVITSISTTLDYGKALAIQSDGKILLAGHSHDGSYYNVTLVRYNTDGSLDTSFDSDGIATASAGTASDYAEAIILDSSGKILVAGYSSMGSSTDFSIYRFNSDGSLDTSFDSDGKKTIDFSSGNDWGKDIAVQSDGKILISGYAVDSNGKQKFAIARLLADGSLDTSFDSDGLLLASVSSYHHSNGGIVIQSNGKILIGGEVDHSPSDIALVRLNTDGSYDSNFDLDGKLYTDLGSADYGNAIAIQPNDKLLVAGTSNSHFAVVRYILDEISPVTPINLIAAPGNQKVTLTWDQNSEADFGKYIIYGGTSANPTTKVDSTTSITDTTKTITGLTNGTTYYYRITAVDNAGNESGYSNEVNVTHNISVTNVSSSNSDGIYGLGSTISILITFDGTVTVGGQPYLTLETGATDQRAYYQSGGGTNILTFDYTVGSGDESSDLGYPSSSALNPAGGGSSNIRSSSNIDVNPTLPNPGAAGSLSANKNIEVDGIRPATPTGFTAYPGNGKIILSWNANTESDLSYYKITGGSGTTGLSLIATVNAGIQTYTHTGLTNGSTQYYKLYAVDKAGNTSLDTDIISATPDGTPPSTPTNLTATPGNQQVTLTWNQNTETDFAKYYIYGGTSANPTTKVDSTTSITDTTKTITNLANGTIYYYRITAVDTVGNESGYSNEVHVAPTIVDSGLVAYYPFNGNALDGSGNGNDGTENGGVGLIADRFGNVDNAYSFDGIDDKITIPHNSSQVFANGLSVSAWISRQNINHIGFIFSKWGGGSNSNESFYIAENNGYPYGKINFTDTQEIVPTSNDSIPVDEWHFITLTYDKVEATLYVDGIVKATIQDTRQVLTGTLDLIVGSDNSTGHEFKGKIDDIRLYNRGLSATEVDSLFHLNNWDPAPSAPTNLTATPGNQQVTLTWDQNTETDFAKYIIYGGTFANPTTKVDSTTSITDTTKTITGIANGTTYYYRITGVDNAGNESDYSNEVHVAPTIVDSGLVAYYPFTGNALDGSGNGKDGILGDGSDSNTYPSLTSDRFGTAGATYSFDGSDFINLNVLGSSLLPDNHDWTVSLWVNVDKIDFTSTGRFISSRDKTNKNGALLDVAAQIDNYPFRLIVQNQSGGSANTSIISSGLNRNDGNWHHLTGIFINNDLGNDTIKLIVDNGPVSVNSNIDYVINTDNNVYLGSETDRSSFLLGKLDDIRIYNRALTTSEIQTLYHEGDWDPAPAAPTGLTPAPGNQQVTLTWNQNTESDFAKYIIYGDTSASPTTKVDSTTSIIDTTITIPGLTNGTTYYYRITAVDSAGNESGYSNEVVLAPYDSSIPLVFSEYFSSNFDGSKWQFSSGSTGAYQSVNSDSGYIEIHSGTTSGGGGKVLSKDTFSLTANKTIIFKARCKTSNIDGGDWGLWGDNHEGQILFNVYYGGQTGIFAQVRENSTSTVTSVDLDHDSTLIDWHEYKLVCTYSNVMLFIDGVLETTITQNIPLNKPLRIRLDRVSWGTNEHITVDYVEIQSSDATIPSAPTGLTANPGNQQVTLTWNQNTESDFAKYYIYGGTSTSPTTKVDSTTSITDTTKTITSLTNGTTYYHRITALDNGGNESGYSNEVHVAPTIVDSGLVDYYPFNGNALDGSGNGNDGTEYGGVTLTPDRFGNANSAFSFDGVDDYISYPYNTLNDLPKATVGIWVKINNYDNSHWLIFKGYKERSSADYAIKLESGGSGFDPGQVRIFVRDSDTVKGYLVSSSVKIPLNNWVYIVHTWDGNTHNLYLNGKLKESLSSTRTLWSNTDQGVFVGGGDSNGGNSPNLYWTNGDIDAIRIYNRALTTSEIQTLYHAGGWDPAPSAPTNLTVTPGNQQVTLTWNQNTESDFAKYIIYGGTSTNPTTKADSTTNITDTTKTITGLTNGITYYYRITAVDSAGNESGFSNEDSVTPHPVKYVVKTDSTGDFTTIQAGIDSSSNGDTVLVYEGTYLENINFNGKSIVLGSEFLLDADTSHISKTIIDGNQAGRVVTIENGEDSTTQLIGFTIQNGLLTGEFDQGAGINIAGSSEPVLSHLIIRNNKLTAFENIGGGINISSSGHPILRNSIIENNTGRDGAAIAGGSIIENVIIRNNHADPTSIIDIPGGSVTKLSNILFYNNFNGSAIYAEGGTFVLTNSIIIAPENNGTNFFSYGINLTEVGGITSNAFIINSIFWNKLNSPAITFSGANTLVKNITVSHSLIQGGQNSIQNQTGNTVNWLSGNLDVNPLFVDPLNGDFHLKSESHCIGAGIDSILIDTTWYYAPSTDFAGNPRPDPAGSRPDIGAFENSLGMPVFTPPTITKVYPPDDSTGVAVNANLRIIFSEPIFSDSGLISVKRSDGLNEQNIQVDSSALRITGNTVTVDLDSLGGNTSWYVLIDSTAFRDNAGNYFPGIASDTTWNFTTASEAAPTVTISSTESSPTNVTPIPITITFSKNVTGFDSTDVIITNASLSGFTGSGTTYAFDLIPAQDTTITVDIPAEVAQDDQGVGNAAAAQFSIVFNGTAPTVVISSSIASPTNVTPIPIGVTFSEPVTGFDSSDVAVVNGTLSTFTGTDSSYSFNLIPDQDGTVTINIAAGAAQDEAGNDNYAATQFSMVYDGTAPVLASLSPADNATNIATDADLVLTFTEVVQTDTGSITVKQKYDGFTVETIAVTSDSVTISEKSASIAITTLLDSTEYYILIDSTAFQDAAGNYFTGITSDTTWNFTTASPAAATVAMSSTLSSPTNVSPIPVTITFSDSVTGFDSTDVVVGNGTLTSFSGSGTTYILEVTPTIDGDVTVDIAANVALNNAGVGNASATQFSITYDGTAPEVVFSSSAAPATNSSTIPVSASLSESVTDFNSGMVDLSSGYITDFTLNGLNATFNIGGISEGVITVAVKDSAFQDLAHNYNTAVEYSIIYDATAPTPGIVNDGNGTDIDYQSSKTTITANWSGFKDLLSGIDSYQWAIGTSIGWIDVMNWTDVADTVTENTSLTLTNNQTYFIFVRARDAAGNLSPVAVSDGVTIDELPPTVGIPWEGTETTDVDWLSPNIVSIQWNQIQDESIAYYEYSIGKAPGDPDVVDWTPNSTDTMVTMTNLSLSEGVDYYSNLRAIDQAGNQSDVTSSDGFKVDGTAPIAGSVAVQDLVNSYYLESTSTITIQPSGFFDQASGIKTFKVGIGSSKGNNDLVSFVEVDSSGILTLNNLSLTDYQTCYCNVVAVDQVGNVSSLVTSPEFMTYETYLGDYNGDRQIDAIDLANLTVNWPNVDLGPVTGEPPYFIPQFDGVANLRDVMVFTRMWHWSKQSAGSTRIVAKVGSEPVVKQSGKTLIVTLPENTTTGSIELTYPVNLISVENQSESVSEKALSIFYNNEVTGRADLTFTDLSGNPVHEKQITVQVNGKNNVSLDLTYHLFNQQAEKIGSGTVPVEITPVPERFALHQNYPNPFNPITTIQYDLPQESRVELVIYNLMGQEVARLVSKKQQPGYYEVRWNGIDHHGRKVGSGIYFYALQAEAKSQHQTFRKVRKMVLLK